MCQHILSGIVEQTVCLISACNHFHSQYCKVMIKSESYLCVPSLYGVNIEFVSLIHHGIILHTLGPLYFDFTHCEPQLFRGNYAWIYLVLSIGIILCNIEV